ncbi:MAG: hypothetical protein Q9208_007451 [Pyrenodesmia sp. 3 TL-2023]
MSTAPLPTRLTFLSDLPTISPGEKVRFLGCVTNYSTATDNDGANGRMMRRVGAGARDMNKGNAGRQAKIVGVQAVMLWSANGVRLADYEKAVEMRKNIETGSEGPSA